MACIRKRRGRWVCDWRDGAGIRRWRTFDTKKAAEDFLDQERPKTRQWSRPVVDPNITVAEYKARWLDLIKPVVKPRTVHRYDELLTLHVIPVLGETKLQRLHRGRIKEFLAAKLSELKPVRPTKTATVQPDRTKALTEEAQTEATTQKRETLARNTVRNIHAALRAMLRSAVDDGVLVVNPAEKLGRQLRLVTPKATRQEEIKAMTREQRRQFLEAVARHEPRYYPLFFTLAGTGTRMGEALALQWEDVDVLRREIRVARALSQGQVETPKSGHGRTVDLSQPLADTLARLEVDRKAETLRKGWREMPPWVFLNEASKLLDDGKVRKVMSRILKKAKLPPHFSPHCLRHTYASLMLQQGESVAYVQRQLGHASIQLTVDTYGKWLPLGNKGAVDRLDGWAGEASGSKLVAEAGGRPESHSQPLEKLVPPTRIERATRGLGNRCSIQLSYGGVVGTIPDGWGKVQMPGSVVGAVFTVGLPSSCNVLPLGLG